MMQGLCKPYDGMHVSKDFDMYKAECCRVCFSLETMIMALLFYALMYCHHTYALPKVEWGYTGFTPMSVRLSVEMFPELFEKTIGSIHFIPGIYPYGVSLLTPINFSVPSLIVAPLVAKYLAENWVSVTFWKNYWPNSFHTWHLPSPRVSLLTPKYFRVPSLIFGPRVAKYLAENGVSGIKKKTIGFICYITGI